MGTLAFASLVSCDRHGPGSRCIISVKGTSWRPLLIVLLSRMRQMTVGVDASDSTKAACVLLGHSVRRNGWHYSGPSWCTLRSESLRAVVLGLGVLAEALLMANDVYHVCLINMIAEISWSVLELDVIRDLASSNFDSLLLRHYAVIDHLMLRAVLHTV